MADPQELIENIEKKESIITLCTTVNDTEQVPAVEKLAKISHPKRKFAIIHGNPDVRTVEEEMEKTFYKLNMISECNYGVLQKIGWMRASRTDKRVSAIMNVVSCKLHRDPTLDEEEMKSVINSALPQDIKIFRIIEMSNTFNSKGDNNNREYHYILPSFMLEPKSTSVKTETGVTCTSGNYNYRISPELHEKVKNICKTFKGTKKYHNYTKKLSFNDTSSQRHIYELSCDELIDYEEFQGIKFKIVGQSFLYNQIRKMIGSLIDVCREERDMTYLENSFLSNKMDMPKAPAEGLYLKNIDYSRYNNHKLTKKNPIYITEKDEKEMEDFRLELVKNIKEAEMKDKVFSKWLYKFDHGENIY